MMEFSLITLPLLSNLHKVVQIGILSCRGDEFEWIIRFYWVFQTERDFDIKKYSPPGCALEME